MQKLHSFGAKYTFSHFSISLTKSLFIDNNTTHILQYIIIHYSSFSHSIILKLHHFCCPKHMSISFFISHTKSPFLADFCSPSLILSLRFISLSPSYAETSLILLQNTHFHTSPSLLQSPSS